MIDVVIVTVTKNLYCISSDIFELSCAYVTYGHFYTYKKKVDTNMDAPYNVIWRMNPDQKCFQCQKQK